MEKVKRGPLNFIVPLLGAGGAGYFVFDYGFSLFIFVMVFLTFTLIYYHLFLGITTKKVSIASGIVIIAPVIGAGMAYIDFKPQGLGSIYNMALLVFIIVFGAIGFFIASQREQEPIPALQDLPLPPVEDPTSPSVEKDIAEIKESLESSSIRDFSQEEEAPINKKFSSVKFYIYGIFIFFYVLFEYLPPRIIALILENIAKIGVFLAIIGTIYHIRKKK